MDFLNKRIIHSTLGQGVVCEYNHPHFCVRFGEKVLKFSYPGSFAGYLRFADEEDQRMVEDMIREKEEKQAKEKLIRVSNYIPSASSKNKPSEVKNQKNKVEKTNIAFKCNFCDGGSNKYHIGYRGACSDEMIQYNIQYAQHSWCSDPNCPCSQYLHGEIDARELDGMCQDGGSVCYESQMLREWTAFAGFVLTGDRKNEPKKIKRIQINSLAVLTTRKPDMPEEDRFIFGVFLVDDAGEGNNAEEGFVQSNSKYRIELSPSEAPRMKFWNYHSNDNNPSKAAWSQGLYRYISDMEAVQILRDIVEIKRIPVEKQLARELLAHFCTTKKIDISTVPEATGALRRNREE